MPGQWTSWCAECRAGGPIGIRDNMALVGVLSTQLLDQTFIREAAVGSPPDSDSLHAISPAGGVEAHV